MIAALLAWAPLTGCGEPSADTAAAEAPIPEMAPRDLLIRTSIDLRGVRPSADDYAALEADPAALEGLIDGYLLDERFGEQVADLFSELYRTRIPNYGVEPERFGVPDALDHPRFHFSMGSEALQILARVADEDLPYTELVTGDWTVVNELLAPAWPTDYFERYGDDATGWREASYTDGRPAAGVLSSSAIWSTYPSTLANANRKRANAVSRMFLCQDYLSKLIDFDDSANILTEDAVQSALESDPTCLSCHVVLEPLASFFYGFWIYNPEHPTDVTNYHPEREQVWREITGVPPNYFGQEAWTLADLGRSIADDGRFTECAAEQVFELLLRRESGLDDAADLSAHRDDFIEGGLTVRALYRSVIDSPLYRAGVTDDPRATPLKMASPYQLAGQIEDLTGFDWWSARGTDMLRYDAEGLRTLAGGVDGYDVVVPRSSPNPTVLLVQERLAELAGWHVAQSDAALDAGDRRLLGLITFEETPSSDPGAVAAQVQALHWRLFGARVEPDGEEVTEALALWSALHDYHGDPVRAWGGLIAALLRDPRILMY